VIDINDPNFAKEYDPKTFKGTVGVVGHGYVGQAVEAYFKDNLKVLVYDLNKPELGTLENVVKNAELVFVCVPTPMRLDGSCYTGIVESVLKDIVSTAKNVQRKLDSFVVVVKSTVTPGFTEEMQNVNELFGLRLLFSPEFLTEKNSIKDFKLSTRFVFGGEELDAMIACLFFKCVNPERTDSNRLLLIQCDPTVAEMVKLFTNGILTVKVAFCNEIYQMCQKLGINYDEVRELSCLDPRVGPSHTFVPGHDGHLGFGGSCFSKDLNNLIDTCKKLGVEQKLFSAAWERNLELRPEKDWEDLKGRAVVGS
jgi:UDPglucose 6-dehydrogenase